MIFRQSYLLDGLPLKGGGMCYCLRIIAVIMAIGLIISGCASVPAHMGWRPWTRYFETSDVPKTGMVIKTEIAGQVDPLLGTQNLREAKIKEEMDHLLERRGYIIGNDSFEYRMVLTYRTEKEADFAFSSESRTFGLTDVSSRLGSVAGAIYGLGVSAANAVSKVSVSSITVSKSTVEKATSYTHSAALEIFARDGRAVWKGEALWNSAGVDIDSDIFWALQLMLSNLPYNPLIKPEVPEVNEIKACNYYQLYCSGKVFKCPALPYGISFESQSLNSDKNYTGASFQYVQVEVYSPNALAAYIDLLQTAEYALPTGDNDWKDPMRGSLWRKVELGGQYLLGNEKRPVNILIKLRGEKEGYYIEKCWIATDKEFAAFETRMTEWRSALMDFFNIYSK